MVLSRFAWLLVGLGFLLVLVCSGSALAWSIDNDTATFSLGGGRTAWGRGAAGYYNGYVYFFFGGDGAGGAYYSNISRYDPATDTLTVVANSDSEGSDNNCAARIGNTFYIFGGWNSSGALNATFRFNAATNTLTEITNLTAFGGTVTGDTYGDRGLEPAEGYTCAAWRYLGHDVIYIFSPPGTSRTVWRFFPENLTLYNTSWFVPNGFGNQYGCAVNTSHGIYICPGSQETDARGIIFFDPMTGEFSFIGWFPAWYAPQGGNNVQWACVINDTIYMLGDTAGSRLYSFNTSTAMFNTYEPIEVYPGSPWYGMAVAADPRGDWLVFAGGNNGTFMHVIGEIHDLRELEFCHEAGALDYSYGSVYCDTDQTSMTFGNVTYSMAEGSNGVYLYRYDHIAGFGHRTVVLSSNYCGGHCCNNGTHFFWSGGNAIADHRGTVWCVDPLTGACKVVGALSYEVWDHMSYYHNGFIYIFGGQNSTVANINSIARFDPSTNTTIYLTHLPRDRIHMSGCDVGGTLYIFGGYSNSLAGYVAEVMSYDYGTTAPTWLMNLTEAMDGIACYPLGTDVWLFGGYGSGGATDGVYRYDTVGNSLWHGNMNQLAGPGPRGIYNSLAMWWNDGRDQAFYIFVYNYEEVYRYVVNNSYKLWHSYLPADLEKFDSCPHGGDVYIFGGEDVSDYPSATILRFQTSGYRFVEPFASLRMTVYYHSVSYNSSRAYIVGGYSDLAGRYTSMIQVYNFSAAVVADNLSVSLGSPLYQAGSALLGDCIYVAGGDDSVSIVSNIRQVNLTSLSVNTTFSALPRPICRTLVFTDGEYVFIAGGYDDSAFDSNHYIFRLNVSRGNVSVDWILETNEDFDRCSVANLSHEFFFGGSSSTQQIWYFNSSTYCLKQVNGLDYSSQDGDICYANGRLWVVGGASVSVIFDYSGAIVEKIGHMPRAVSHGKAVYYDHSIYYVGGYRSGVVDPTSAVSRFDLRCNGFNRDEIPAWGWIYDNDVREYTWGSYWDETSRLYVYSGSRDVYLIDFASGVIDAFAQLPVALKGAGLAKVGDYLYVFGGSDGTAPHKDVYRIDLSTNVTTYFDSLPFSWCYGSVEVYNDLIYLIGGRGGVQSGASDGNSRQYWGVWSYNVSTKVLSRVTTLPVGGWLNTVRVGSKIYFVGEYDGEVPANWMYSWDIATNTIALIGYLPPGDTIDEVSLCSDGTYIYVLPGGSYQGIWRIDPDRDQDGYHQIPHALSCSAVASDGSDLYIFGGFDAWAYEGGTRSVARAEIWRFDPDTFRYSYVNGHLPRGLCRGVASYYDNRFFYFGGYNGSVTFDKVYEFDSDWNWTEVAVLSNARRDMACTLQGGLIYLIGGDSGGVLDTVQSFNPVTYAFDDLNDLPDSLCNMTADGNSTFIWVCGGWNGVAQTNNIYRYDIAGNSWSTPSTLPYSIEGSLTVFTPDESFSNEDCVFSLGGYDGYHYISDIFRYFVNNGTVVRSLWMGDNLSFAGGGCGADFADGSVYTFGGCVGYALRGAYRYVPNATSVWAWAGIPSPRDLGTASYYNGVVYLLGGSSSVGSSDVQVLNLSLNASDNLGAVLSGGYEYCDSVVVGNYVYVFGGGGVDRFDPSTNTSVSWDSIPGGLDRPSVCHYSGSMVFVVGGSLSSTTDLLRYEVTGKSWTYLGSLPHPLSHPRCWYDGHGYIYIFGGAEGVALHNRPSVWRVSTSTWTVEPYTSMPYAGGEDHLEVVVSSADTAYLAPGNDGWITSNCIFYRDNCSDNVGILGYLPEGMSTQLVYDDDSNRVFIVSGWREHDNSWRSEVWSFWDLENRTIFGSASVISNLALTDRAGIGQTNFQGPYGTRRIMFDIVNDAGASEIDTVTVTVWHYPDATYGSADNVYWHYTWTGEIVGGVWQKVSTSPAGAPDPNVTLTSIPGGYRFYFDLAFLGVANYSAGVAGDYWAFRVSSTTEGGMSSYANSPVATYSMDYYGAVSIPATWSMTAPRGATTNSSVQTISYTCNYGSNISIRAEGNEYNNSDDTYQLLPHINVTWDGLDHDYNLTDEYQVILQTVWGKSGSIPMVYEVYVPMEAPIGVYTGTTRVKIESSD